MAGVESSLATDAQHGLLYAPQPLPDVPISAVFLVLFTFACAAHVVVFRHNTSQGKTFWFNLMVAGKSSLSGFCLTRIIATILRIAWALNPGNIGIGVAATIPLYTGVVLLFVVNLLFAQRLVRAQHPRFGWGKPCSLIFPALIAITILTVVCLVVAVVVKSATLDPSSQHATTAIQRYAATWLAVFAFIPVIMAGASALARKHPHIRMTKTIDKFGGGSMRAKVAIVLVSGLLLCLGASFRAGVAWMPPSRVFLSTNPARLAPEPAYRSKACFYIFDFAIDASVSLFWLAIRVDKRFHIPDRASGAFSYAGGFIFAGEAGNEKKRLSILPGNQSSTLPPSSTPGRDSRRGSRLSLVSLEGRQERFERLENRISWGGVSSEAIQHILAEDGKREIPYPAVLIGCTEEDIAVDMEDGAKTKEMGFDPKTGKYALRPIVSSTGRTSRPVSMAPSVEVAELP